MIKTVWPALAFALGCGTAQAAHFSFADWEIACDNTRHCEAAGYHTEGDPAPVVLWLARDAGVAAPLKAKLNPFTEGSDQPEVVTLQVGQTTVRGLRAYQELTAEQVAALLPLLLDAESARVSDGKRTWTLSLAGMKAALLKLDDLQGRVGTPTALITRGSRPARLVLAPLPAPQVRPLTPVATSEQDRTLLPLIVKSLAHGGCERPPDMGNVERYNTVFRLSASQVLLVLECGRSGYQSSYAVWTANDQPPYAPRSVQPPGPTGAGIGYLLNVAFDAGQLSTYAKGRDLADCNVETRWLWTADGFRLTHVESSQLCRNIPNGYPLRDYTATVVRPAGIYLDNR